MALEQETVGSDRMVLTDDDWADMDEGIRDAEEPEDNAVALWAKYEPKLDVVLLQLKTGQRVAVPREDLQGLSDASADELAEVKIESYGRAVHWEKLEEGFLVDSLRRGVYGSERWMAGLAQRRRERLAKAS